MRLHKEWKIALGAIAAAVAVACGGDGGGGGGVDNPPVATVNIEGPTILRDGAVVIRFSESMDPASLQLSGALVGQAAGTWSKTAADNDTYTLRPANGAWSLGVWLDLVVGSASDASGQALAGPVTKKYLVPLVFENNEEASAVIGQADFDQTDPNRGAASPSGNSLAGPYGAVSVAPDGRLFIPDTGNFRVLAFDGVPAGNDASAAYALGAASLLATGNPMAAASSVGKATNVAFGFGRMAVADIQNHRVLIYGATPQSKDDAPAVVIGQTGFDGAVQGCTAGQLNGPSAAALTPSGRLVVADSDNNRVLIWNTVPDEHGKAADLVLGQQGFGRCVQNDAGYDGTRDARPTERTMSYPSSIWSDDTRLAVVDSGNSRVLIWNAFPTNSGQPADVVLGQSDFTRLQGNDVDQNRVGDDVGTSAEVLNGPYMLASNGVQLAVSDSGNHRVLIWNTFPDRNFQPANTVLGQPDMNTLSPAALLPRSPKNTFGYPGGLHFSGGRLFVTDYDLNRVLIFTSR